MKDNYLTFERDMNIHEQKVYDLKRQLNEIIDKLDRIYNMERVFDEAIYDLEIKKIKLMNDFSDLQTPYIEGGDDEIDFIAQEKIDGGNYQYRYYTNGDREHDS